MCIAQDLPVFPKWADKVMSQPSVSWGFGPFAFWCTLFPWKSMDQRLPSYTFVSQYSFETNIKHESQHVACNPGVKSTYLRPHNMSNKTNKKPQKTRKHQQKPNLKKSKTEKRNNTSTNQHICKKTSSHRMGRLDTIPAGNLAPVRAAPKRIRHHLLAEHWWTDEGNT